MSTGHICGNMKERTMQHIPTKATAVEKLKRLAKTHRKTTGTSLAVALDAVAKQHGYEHWKHVTICQEQTAVIHRTKPLPEALKQYLDEAAARQPAAVETQVAFEHGFVFAMDVKDAADIALTPDYTEADDGWHLAARDLCRFLVHHRDEDTGATLYETQSDEDLIEIALDDLSNYRCYRYLGDTAPTTLEDAFGRIRQLAFFPPTHIWLSGKCIDLEDVPEIRIGGKVVFSTMPGTARAANSNRV